MSSGGPGAAPARGAGTFSTWANGLRRSRSRKGSSGRARAGGAGREALARLEGEGGAVGSLARRGVRVVSPTARERRASGDMVVCDKTGPLTAGRPILLDQRTLGPADIAMAASLAVNSRHPLAR